MTGDFKDVVLLTGHLPKKRSTPPRPSRSWKRLNCSPGNWKRSWP
jgi:hypothetical protein